MSEIDQQLALRLAAVIREACVQAALTGYENAALDGLCPEGAQECAIEAIRAVPIEALVARSLAAANRR
jgi:hypothetical protein